jgi:hypothetical protein
MFFLVDGGFIWDLQHVPLGTPWFLVLVVSAVICDDDVADVRLVTSLMMLLRCWVQWSSIIHKYI